MDRMEVGSAVGTGSSPPQDRHSGTDQTSSEPSPDRDRLDRLWPFAIVAVIGQLSAVWPPGPTDLRDFAISTLLLCVSLFLALVVRRGPLSANLIAATTYVGSVAFLMLATGGVASGLGSLLFIPVVALALYGKPRDSAVVVVPIFVALLAVSLQSSHVAAATVRRVVLFGGIAAMLSVAIHALRKRLVESNRRTTRLLHQAEAINMAAGQLASLLDPRAITTLGVELAARIASQPGTILRRALYFHIEEDRFRVDAQFDDLEVATDQTWSLDEHPDLKRVVECLEPLAAEIDLERVGPSVRSVLESTGVTHGAFVPVCPDGTLHGVLAVAGRGTPIDQECLELCVALGHFLELALSNWNAHQRLEEQATVEERRRIARELHDGLAHELAFIASRARRSARVGAGALDMRELANAADRALDEARRAITVLSANQPQSLGSAVAQAADDLGARLGVRVSVDIREDVSVSGQVRENLLRIVREAITNAANHGRPEHITVRLHLDEGLRLVVEDDGCGFETHGTRPSSGFGLLSMEERAASVGGHLNVDSGPMIGTRVEVSLP